MNLTGKDSLARKQARKALVNIGALAVPLLMEALVHSKKYVRWEAAKALSAIPDARSAPFLVKALTDKSFEVRWLAAEGLIALQLQSLQALAKALVEDPENWDLRQGAHHVLHALERGGFLNKECLALLDSLRNLEPALSIPAAAEKALCSIRK